MDMRQDLNLRGCYDKEVERWIDELRKQVKDVSREVGTKKETIDKELKRSRELKELVRKITLGKRMGVDDAAQTVIELINVQTQTVVETTVGQVQTEEVPVANVKQVEIIRKSDTNADGLIATLSHMIVLGLVVVVVSFAHYFYTSNVGKVLFLLVKSQESKVVI
jgi:hypothetical protein